MIINHLNKTIELTKTENRAASKYNSEMYKMLNDARRDYPSYNITVLEKTTHKRSYRGLNYTYMEKYIRVHDENGTIMEEYNVLRGKESDEECNLISAASYGEIKSWFFKTFPEIKEREQKVSIILNKSVA